MTRSRVTGPGQDDDGVAAREEVNRAGGPAGTSGARGPRSRVFDVMVGASLTALVGVGILAATGHFAVSTPYGGVPIPHGSTAVNRCQSLVLEKLPVDADVDFSDRDTTEQLYPDRSWVVRGPVDVMRADGTSRDGEYVCDHLRDLPPGSGHWQADQVVVLGV